MTSPSSGSLCSVEQQARLHHYLDGELRVREQAHLFRHLADCASCREIMESVLVFRRVAREEYLAMPPAADDQFFARLDRLSAQRGQLRSDRAFERAPMWRPRRRVSIGSLLLVAVAVFALGLVLPRQSAPVAVVGEEDRVQFDRPVGSTVYVIYPGLTVEAMRVVESLPLEATAPLEATGPLEAW